MNLWMFEKTPSCSGSYLQDRAHFGINHLFEYFKLIRYNEQDLI